MDMYKTNYPYLYKAEQDDPGTVIDDAWVHNMDPDLLENMLGISGLKSNKDLLYYYEGFTLKQFTELFFESV